MVKVKYPVVYVYIKTKDSGKELKASLRSLKNIKNFNGQVFVVGDSEDWFKNIKHIPKSRIYGKAFADQVAKMKMACKHPAIPDKFIAMMDDIYITKPTEAGVYIKGDMNYSESTPHQRTKKHTAEFLRDIHKIEKPKDYETHAPMLVKKGNLLVALEILSSHPVNPSSLQWRSIYGNLFNVDGEIFEDQKTKTKELKEGAIISTQFFTPALEALFPVKSKYEL